MDVQQIGDVIHNNIVKFGNKNFYEFYTNIIEKSAKELSLSHAELETILVDYYWYNYGKPRKNIVFDPKAITTTSFYMGYPSNSTYSKIRSK